MGYDALNRPSGYSYTKASGNPNNVADTSTITYGYDQACPGDSTNFKGALSSVASGTNSTCYTSDALGRIAKSKQTTPGYAPFQFSYGYSLTDQLTSMTYPSGRQVNYNLDSVDRVSSVQNMTGGGNYASISYTAPGGIDTMTMGNQVTQHITWNDRLQPTQLQVMNSASQNLLTLGFYPCPGTTFPNCTTGNNGNLQSQSISFPALGSVPGLNLTQSYSYTTLNRLTSATEGGNTLQTYGYAGNGNRYVSRQGTGLPTLSLETPQAPSWFTGSNRINGWSYDANGNVTQVGSMNRGFTYDAADRQVSATINSTTASYSYDGNGLRVSKTVGGVTTTYVYDAFGDLAAEYGGSSTSPCGTSTCYVTADHLGSTRMLTDNVVGSTNVRRYDYLPFGDEILAGINGRTTAMGYPASPDSFLEKFTSKERDAETGLDYFGFRYMSSAQGRFTSPDKPFADQTPSDPQSWNLYSYVRNNPLRLIDPTGRKCVTLDGGGKGDDGQGETCNDPSLNTTHGVTVGVGRDEANLIMLSMVGEGLGGPVGWADIGRHGMEGAMLAEGLWNLPGALRSGLNLLRGLSGASEMIPGLYGGVSRAALEAAASGGGETVKVVTNLTQAPAAGRGLSVAVGEGAEALAGAARSGGTTYVAQIPKALLNVMRGAGLVTESTTQMGGAAATEFRFAPNAAEFVTKFFKPIQ